MECKLILSHPYGAPFVREAARALNDAAILDEIHTTLSFEAESSLSKVPFISRRAWLPKGPKIKRVLWTESIRQIFLRLGINNLLNIRGQSLSDFVYKRLDLFTSKNLSQASGVYCYEDGALESFKSANKLGIKCLYDLPILYHKEAHEIELSEAEQYPELRGSFLTLSDSQEKKERKDQELSLASHIIVASQVTKDSLVKNGFNSNKISIVPYGSPELNSTMKKGIKDRKFRVLFLGRVGPRKGVHRLLEAWNKLKLEDAELILAGTNEFPKNYLDKHLGAAKYVGQQSSSSVSKLLASSDLLAFPSLVEGFGLVILEALAQGVPVLATERTALAEIMGGKTSGYIVPAQNTEKLTEALEHAYLHREELTNMSNNALEVSRNYNWSYYREKLVKTVSNILGT